MRARRDRQTCRQRATRQRGARTRIVRVVRSAAVCWRMRTMNYLLTAAATAGHASARLRLTWGTGHRCFRCARSLRADCGPGGPKVQGVMIRRAQLILTTLLAVEAAIVFAEANALAQSIRVTGDGDVLPSAWLFPSPFSGGGALLIAVVLAGFLLASTPSTKRALFGSITVFILGTLGLWSFHRVIVWMHGVSHGLPGWW